MTDELKAELKELEAMPDDRIDASDAPPVTDWTGARRGRFYRPTKHQLTLRLDADVVSWFKDAGNGYQTRINQVLRDYAERHGLQRVK